MKRISSSILALAMVFTCCCGVASAAENSDTRASLTLSFYNAELVAGQSRRFWIRFGWMEQTVILK